MQLTRVYLVLDVLRIIFKSNERIIIQNKRGSGFQVHIIPRIYAKWMRNTLVENSYNIIHI